MGPPSSSPGVDALAADYVAALPRPDRVSRPVDVETIEKLAGDRLSPAQRRCLRRMRDLFAEREP